MASEPDATKPADKPDNTGALVKLGLGVTALVAIAVVAVVFLKSDDDPPTLTDQDAGMEACLQLATLESKRRSTASKSARLRCRAACPSVQGSAARSAMTARLPGSSAN